ncbi:type VII secretion-associated protein [Nocardia sp. NPDC058658]|uniref:type VII secretion-associated protein n=1 Tax=Nocardia sp. NPDC058658 TaxID=3346580 RepID=UPI003655D48A
MDAGFVNDIDVVISDARMWARTATRHADVVASVMPVQNGLAVGVPVGPTHPAVYAWAMADSAWIGFMPAPVSAAAAIDAMVDELFSDLRPLAASPSISVAHPSSWSSVRRASIENSLGRYSSNVVLEPVSTRIAALRQPLATSELIVVVEIEPLDVTVSAVGRSRDHVVLSACERDPTMGADEVSEAVSERLAAMILRVLDGHRPSTVVVVGQHDERLLELLRAFVAESWSVQQPLVQPMAFTALLRSWAARVDQGVSAEAQRQSDWVGTLRDRAAASAPSPWGGPAKIAAVAAVILTVLTVGVVVIATTRGGGADATATGETTTRLPEPTTSLPSSSRSPAPSPHHAMGRVTFDVPQDWQLAPGATPERATLVPKLAAAARITVTYNTVADRSGYDEVLRDITSRIDRAEPGRFGTPERDVVFAGRRGIGYQELPGDGSVVRWYVLLDHGVQTNVGCQHGSEGWGTVGSACEEVMRSVAITP